MNILNLNLIELACELKQGNYEYEDQFYKSCYEEVARVIQCKNYTIADNAVGEDDLVQKVTIAVWKKIAQFDNNKGSFCTWLNSIIDSVCKNEYKKAKRNKAESLDEMSNKDEGTGAWEPVDRNPGPEAMVLSNESISELNTHISKLPLKQQQALAFQVDGYKVCEIANIMDAKRGNVSNWLNRAHKSLEKSIEREALSMDDCARVA